MIRNLIIDLGGVIVPLSIANTIKKLQALNIQENNYEKMPLFEKFEIGEITADEFLNTIKKKIPPYFNRAIFRSMECHVIACKQK